MSYLLTQMFLYLLVAFLLGLLLGWLIWRYGKSTAGDYDAMRAERDALAKERDDLQTNLDACRTRSAQQRDALEALEQEKASWADRPTPAAAPIAATRAPASKPQGLTAARGGQPDNLQEINGVGPKMERMLNDLGYFHFDQIADWTEAEVAWVDDNLEGFKGRVTRDNWQPQAKAFAKR